jgi:hypothetical protein
MLLLPMQLAKPQHQIKVEHPQDMRPHTIRPLQQHMLLQIILLEGHAPEEEDVMGPVVQMDVVDAQHSIIECLKAQTSPLLRLLSLMHNKEIPEQMHHLPLI